MDIWFKETTRVYIDILVVGLLAGWLLGGTLKNLGRLPLRGTGWFLFLGALELAMWATQAPERRLVYQVLIMAAAAVAAGLLWANRHLPGIWLVLAGLLLNLTVMAANGGRMPVSAWAATVSGQAQHLPELYADAGARHVLLQPGTRLALLGDMIPLPSPYPAPKVLSLGDLFIFAGIIRLMVRAMSGRTEQGARFV